MEQSVRGATPKSLGTISIYLGIKFVLRDVPRAASTDEFDRHTIDVAKKIVYFNLRNIEFGLNYCQQ